MGAAKDTYEILTDLWDRYQKGMSASRKQMAKDLGEISALLDRVVSEFRQRKVPKKDGHHFVRLINISNKLAEKYKQEDVELALLFDNDLINVGRMMRDVDYFIDGISREEIYHTHPVFEGDHAKYPDWAEDQIRNVCDHLEGISGDLLAYKRRYEV